MANTIHIYKCICFISLFSFQPQGQILDCCFNAWSFRWNVLICRNKLFSPFTQSVKRGVTENSNDRNIPAPGPYTVHIILGSWWGHSYSFIPWHDTSPLSFSLSFLSEDTVDILREMGGVAFIYNLSISTIVHSDVKKTALFILGTLAEASGRHVCNSCWSPKGAFYEGYYPQRCVFCSKWSPQWMCHTNKTVWLFWGQLKWIFSDLQAEITQNRWQSDKYW